MSLINEALKRTRDTAYRPAQNSSPIVSTEYRFDTPTPTRTAKPIFLAVGVSTAAVLIGSALLATWLVHRVQGVKDALTLGRDSVSAEAKPSAPVVHHAVPTDIPPGAPVATPLASTTSPPPAAPPDSKASEEQIVAKVMERIKAEQPAAPSAPSLVLQGITYAADNRDAMINGVTVHEGEVIERARVVTIENHRVTLDFNGQQIILRLP